MKRFLALILLIPQLLYAQYQSKEFMLPSERNAICQAIGINTARDSIVSLNINHPISGFFISGGVTLGNTYDSYTRVTVKDKGGSEYLVYESYPLLSDGNYSRLSKVAVESRLLDGIVPTSMKIEVHNASIHIDSVYLSAAQNRKQGFQTESRTIRQEQAQYIAKKLNDHLRDRRFGTLHTYMDRGRRLNIQSSVPCRIYGYSGWVVEG